MDIEPTPSELSPGAPIPDAPTPINCPLAWLHRFHDGRIAEEARLVVKAGGSDVLALYRQQGRQAATLGACRTFRSAVAARRATLSGSQALADPWLTRLVATLSQARGRAAVMGGGDGRP